MKKIKLNIQRYASGGFEFAASGYLQGKIEWVSTSNGPSANSSNVSMSLLARRTNNYSTTGTWTGNMNIQNNDSGVSYYETIGNSWVVIGQKTVTVAHNNDGTCSCYIGGSVTGPSGTLLSGNTSVGSQWVTLDTIPRQAYVSDATNFNDEGNPTIYFTNPAGFRINARLEFSGSTIQRDNIPNTGSYTFNLTNAERDLLRSKCPNSNTLGVREVIATYVNSSSENAWSWRDRTMNIVNANPTFSDFEFEDVNATTLALTGDSSKNVNGYSNIKTTISTTNKAIANKSATMSKYQFRVGTGTPLDIVYSSSESVNGTINNASSGVYNVYAIDSRGNPTLVTKLASQEIPYTPITFNVDSCFAERSSGGVGGQVTLNYSGTFWNDNFGQVTNTIKSASYEFKKTTDSTWITGTTDITPTVSGNNFSFSATVRSDNPDYSFDLESSYDFRITLTDELSTKSIQLTPLGSAVPNIALADNGVGIMGKYDEEVGGLLQVGGKNIVPEITTLWSGTKNTTGTIQLSKEYTNYDFLLIGIQAQSYSKGSELIPVSDIQTSSSSNNTYEITVFQSSSVYSGISIRFEDTTTINFLSTHAAGWNNCNLKYVIGIKL